MAACCAVGAFIICKLIALHSRLPSFASEQPKQRQSHRSLPSTGRCRVNVKGLTCGACVATVKEGLATRPGVISATLSLHSATACVTYDPQLIGSDSIITAIVESGYEAKLLLEADTWRSQWLLAADARDGNIQECRDHFNLAVFANGMSYALNFAGTWMIAEPGIAALIFQMSSAIIAIASMVFAARPLHHEAISALVRWRLTSSLLSSLGIFAVFASVAQESLASMLSSNPGIDDTKFSLASVCMLITLTMGGRLTKALVAQRTSQFPTALASAFPDTAKVVVNMDKHVDDLDEVPIDLLRAGDMVLVDAGAPFPADCEVLKGCTNVLETIINGETVPRSVTLGQKVYAGSKNCGSSVVVQIKNVGGNTWLGHTLNALAKGAHIRSTVEQFSDRLLSWFNVAVLCVALFLAMTQYIQGLSARVMLNNAATVLLCACPCTLGIGISTCLLAASSNAHQAGVVLRSGPHIEKSAESKFVVFDKTGTLTRGKLEVVRSNFARTTTMDYLDRRLFWKLVESLTSHSKHPVSQLLWKDVARQTEQTRCDTDTTPVVLEEFEEIPGLGCTGLFRTGHEAYHIAIGNNRLMQSYNIYSCQPAQKQTDSWSLTSSVVYIAINHELAAEIFYQDSVVPDAAIVIRTLHELGFKTCMMTGDTKKTAQSVAIDLNIPLNRVYHSLLPHEKSALIQQLEQKNGPIIMVGDNLNDAPALVASSLGIVISHDHQSSDLNKNYDDAIMAAFHVEADAVILPIPRSHGAGFGPKRDMHGISPLSSLRKILYIIDLVRETNQRMRRVLWWSLLYNAVALVVCCGIPASFLPDGFQYLRLISP
ncbi:hypothetical protein BS50DRAFT_620111 [Corynespora cassiicola Philippines]|uniref:HMA domain-containing protein n=1 Tax=Corynespora cassiicola Philippines TaxID=1448308 RepID=A0A2T2NQ83_CORCC|nr:hypothetical protein BS50DRAFT_620111 [Corynespora cassiicola Philippines]